MAFASAIARPYSVSAHDLRFMSDSVSLGYSLSIPKGKYFFLPGGDVIKGMDTVFETRRARLRMLAKQHGSVAELNRALGWDETNGRLYQIHNKSVRKERGTFYEMGDPTARQIEEILKLPVGWMDTPPTYAELNGEQDPLAIAWAAFESLPPELRPTAVRLIDALTQPAKPNGITDSQQ